MRVEWEEAYAFERVGGTVVYFCCAR